jgi:hypothetical protein
MDLNTLEQLKELAGRLPKLPVILFSWINLIPGTQNGIALVFQLVVCEKFNQKVGLEAAILQRVNRSSGQDG